MQTIPSPVKRVAAKTTPRLVGTGSGAEICEFRVPEIRDLANRLRFAPQQGRIWLDDQRMMLMHVSSLGALRQELIESLGAETARGIVTRIGYQAGACDAEMAKKLRSSCGSYNHFLAGPQLVSLEGIVHCEPLALEIDVGSGHYFGDFALIDCAEAEAHVARYGIGEEPSCWMLVGYACGYTSRFMGRPILWREIECKAMGHDRCRVVGRPVEEWGDDAREDLRFLQIGDFVKWTPAPPNCPAPHARVAARAAASQENTFGMVGISGGFNTVCHLVKKVAPTDATVLFLGESGVGKEIFSQNLHRLSKRAKAPFIAVNCAAIPEQLVESELFGVEKGGYTGAVASRPGRLERADGGTLFLDEIGTLSYTAQGKLLRALQEGEIERVGDTRVRKVDVRIVAATNVNLCEAVKEGTFREDLYYRLNVFPIRVPPLRDRRDDIPLLMNWFMQRTAKKHGKTVTGFRERAVDAMINYSWPGNVREMENIIERAVILADDGGALDISHLFTNGEDFHSNTFVMRRNGGLLPAAEAHLPGEAPEGGLPALADTEARMLRLALAEAKGNLSLAARLLSISRPTLAYRLRKHKIEA
ncbi:sigma 54-interacting transcriptional regulator [Rhodoblastus acidophilus]|uniref:Sigma 54-interacting transcriptional regulator n=1 Tax=Candidatus Rhodoblastus alkanivorans TaxID=2954117 RepID=A0ABS9Z5M2_9HYPH|nr:sigma 54-interacting transcriptional regulator [Candidatus Rhodoblastus alkanivorans]MCI4682381.1 sigma 54-interacting transcriptional regulator [Candidatus Rhodoblastus alkanivorans]MDI4639684.1 sigma 54-interacting transcriptional regulator [Rhodoblastus acidophilus]